MLLLLLEVQGMLVRTVRTYTELKLPVPEARNKWRASFHQHPCHDACRKAPLHIKLPQP
jgi:hypothetical protein